jgi:hypothetical protein
MQSMPFSDVVTAVSFYSLARIDDLKSKNPAKEPLAGFWALFNATGWR